MRSEPCINWFNMDSRSIKSSSFHMIHSQRCYRDDCVTIISIRIEYESRRCRKKKKKYSGKSFPKHNVGQVYILEHFQCQSETDDERLFLPNATEKTRNKLVANSKSIVLIALYHDKRNKRLGHANEAIIFLYPKRQSICAHKKTLHTQIHYWIVFFPS